MTDTVTPTATLTTENDVEVPLGVPVNVKVQGEKAQRKGVTLIEDPNSDAQVRVRTGKPGRPGALPLDKIKAVRVL